MDSRAILALQQLVKEAERVANNLEKIRYEQNQIRAALYSIDRQMRDAAKPKTEDEFDGKA